MTRLAASTQHRRVHVGQGEHVVTSNPNVVLGTVLGSCVAACLRDPAAGIGGMNHFLLPDGSVSGSDAGRRYGAHAMEVLINDLLKHGARRDRLQAKLFGGGRMFNSLHDVGRANSAFAQRFLQDEGIAFVGGSLGGLGGRRVQYWPVSGRALQRAVEGAVEPDRRPSQPTPIDAGAVELF